MSLTNISSYADEPTPAPKPAPVPVQKEEPVAPSQPQQTIPDASSSSVPTQDLNGSGNSINPGFENSGAPSGNYEYQQQNDNGYGNEEQDDQNDGFDQQVGIKEDG